jgi:3-methyl-2-oxobutanoate hydroxymethyltransferase
MLSHKIFQDKCDRGEKLVTVTCYDHWTAKLMKDLPIDMILVGDSVAMVMHGFDSTVYATVDMIETHTAAVARGLEGKIWLISDMPFGSFRSGKNAALDAATRFLRAGAHAVKLEGVRGHEDVVEHLVQSGVPVMGHLGLTPQSHLTLGGHKVQGKDRNQADVIFEEALQLEKLGCFSVVLECVPNALAKKIADELKIPVIGIGAGAEVDGQILVLQDLLGANPNFKPKFLRQYAQISSVLREALLNYEKDVKSKNFPSKEESYT